MAKKSADLPMPAITFDRASATPIHRQLYESFSQSILNRQVRPGAKLPSTRELAGQLRVSRNTVMNAFEQLLADGFLEGRTGSGTLRATPREGQFAARAAVSATLANRV